jgi:hypothetical protein
LAPSVVFLVGHQDTPEAYWRVLLPARAFGAPALFVEDPRAAAAISAARTLWLYQPTGYAAAEAAEKAKSQGRRVIVDLAEDPELRVEYNTHRLDAFRRALAAADTVVVAVPVLRERFPGAEVVPTPYLRGEERVEEWPERPTLLWWTDGRQKAGWEQVAGTIGSLLEERDLRLRHVQLPHLRPLSEGISKEQAAERGRRCHVYLANSPTPDGQIEQLLAGARGCYLHLETYANPYGDCTSDLPLLRAAALGIPSLTMRSQAPPGCIAAPPHRWRRHIEQLIDEPGTHRALCSEARAWAASRASIQAYRSIIGGD